MDTDLALADLISRSFSIEWFEGVAIVREVIERLAERPERSNTVPELIEIRLSAAGRVEISGRTHADEPVRRLGQMLQAVLMRCELPVQLRLVISKATAPEPGFGSIAEFGDALGYFERPQRSTVLQRLYERAIAAPPAADADRSGTLDSMAPLPIRAPALGSARKSNKRFLVRLAAGVAIVLMAFAAAGQYVRMRGVTRETRSRVAATAQRASTVAVGGLLAGVSAVTDRIGLGRLVPPDATAARSAPAPPASPTPAATHPTTRAPREVKKMPFVAFDLEPRTISIRSVDEAAASGADGAAVNAGTASATPTKRSIDSTTYSAGSEGVEPPVAIRPRLPRELPPTVNAEDLSRIELVVGTDGSVESVRLLGRVPSIHDRMFLSVAKAWQFQPAVKNGVAVKYRKTVWIADQ